MLGFQLGHKRWGDFLEKADGVDVSAHPQKDAKTGKFFYNFYINDISIHPWWIKPGSISRDLTQTVWFWPIVITLPFLLFFRYSGLFLSFHLYNPKLIVQYFLTASVCLGKDTLSAIPLNKYLSVHEKTLRQIAVPVHPQTLGANSNYWLKGSMVNTFGTLV